MICKKGRQVSLYYLFTVDLFYLENLILAGTTVPFCMVGRGSLSLQIWHF